MNGRVRNPAKALAPDYDSVSARSANVCKVKRFNQIVGNARVRAKGRKRAGKPQDACAIFDVLGLKACVQRGKQLLGDRLHGYTEQCLSSIRRNHLLGKRGRYRLALLGLLRKDGGDQRRQIAQPRAARHLHALGSNGRVQRRARIAQAGNFALNAHGFLLKSGPARPRYRPSASPCPRRCDSLRGSHSARRSGRPAAR